MFIKFERVHKNHLRIAIQGELGSNSHMAALAMLGASGVTVEIVACGVSAEVFERIVADDVDGAVLPIENSLHGSVAEHYDLLLAQPVRIDRESLLRIRHNVIAMPGVTFGEIRRVMSHPVALAQCRRFLDQYRELQVVPFYDTAGSRQARHGGWYSGYGGNRSGPGSRAIWRGGVAGRDRGSRGELHPVSPCGAG